MKKLYFVMIAILLALAVVSCDNFAKPETGIESVQYAADGTRLATFTLGASGLGRALTDAMDRAGTTYCEASFQMVDATGTSVTPNTIVRATWSWAGTGKITIQPTFYNVILFVGRGSDKTLLGVGRVTSIVGGSSAGPVTAGDTVEITPDTTALRFTVEPLVNSITNTAASTFGTDSGLPTTTTKDQFDNTVPMFNIKKSVGALETAEATWTFAVNTIAVDHLSTYSDDMIIGATVSDDSIKTTGFSSEEALDVPQTLATKTYGGPVAGTPVTGTFIFHIAPPIGEDGVVLVALEIPVCAIANTATANVAAPVVWFIRGGLNNSLVDAGATPTTQKQGALGGAVLIGFGDTSGTPTIELLTPTWP